MFELENKLRELIQWTVNTYGCNKSEAIKSIERKLEEIKK